MSARRRESPMLVFVAAVAAVGVVAVVTGCGHSQNPVAPYDSSAAVPPARGLLVQGDAVGRMVVRWSATAADRTIVDGWFVERRLAEHSSFTRLSTAPQADTVYFDDDVADGTRLVYRVLAVTGAGITSVPVESAPVRVDRSAPSTPVAVVATGVPGGVLLGFQSGGEPDLSFFDVRVSLTLTNLPPEFRQVTSSPAMIAGLVGGNEYAFEVAAVDSAGRISAYSAPPATAVAGP